ncbi:MBL fold metallo-hydrolase [Leptospira sp. 2 VSF19]|uniref:MBL fold metallo-hydrolase n=1 Tax=Leptospira soteropolitanensis TaxID=2950025 RepID=A0AAW5VEH3_9LEPT|nr:MBL fold metallo-hydrolase [Leptospira soteropolitanensis]MCW7493302.1 MBL fold metallo-hydrolase [Leptospira soteropolitanensis]MCW7500629.1 MBL fold metallo-hydrolase [Leptospira soteropolitanensis]MCW7523152.1 MBL fold metallo-hydrolase [Leptospira soteropolitanensis]MCW7526741.1 MBL fold metallo-hydrolase [Leptospira soteropolitanensis]MCW7530870.1 MBL fold metallo-hydrolase [Leptospira soteropolitanensis]
MNSKLDSKPALIIHRGSNVIGGNCIEIIYKSKSIILDLGMPLMNPDGSPIDQELTQLPSIENGILPDIKDLYESNNRIEAVILSHPHMDHYGLMNYIDPQIPIFMGEDTFQILKASNYFLSSKNRIDLMLSHVKTFTKEKFRVGDFEITPYPIDHSAYGAYCILIEVGGKRIFYSGDFRGHGATKYTFDILIKNPPKNIDCLLMEGTSIRESQKEEFSSEESVFLELKRILSETKKITFSMQAGSNITRLIQLYKACLSNGKLLVLDLYQYHLLVELRKLNPSLPPFENERTIRVFFHKNQARKLKEVEPNLLDEYKNRRIGIQEIIKNQHKIVLRLSQYVMEEVSQHLVTSAIDLSESAYLFSMWKGYLKQQENFIEFIDNFKLRLVTVHTSGHAYVTDLQRFVKAINPGYLVPIHTLSPRKYEALFESNIKFITDNTRTIV